MSLLGKVQQVATKVRADGQLNELRFRHHGTWSDGTTCRFGIQDPSKTDAGTKLAQRLSGVPEVLDIRLLRLHPADPEPGEGATLAWDGGQVKLLFWSQPSDFPVTSNGAVGVLRFTR